MKKKKLLSLTILAVLLQGTAFANYTSSDLIIEINSMEGSMSMTKSLCFSPFDDLETSDLSKSVMDAKVDGNLLYENLDKQEAGMVRVKSIKEAAAVNAEIAKQYYGQRELEANAQKPSFKHKAATVWNAATTQVKSFFSSITTSILSCFGVR
ncbi:hypothetical protein [Candidatus Paracaedibacter symbiosus]|uniref:hypothetical protein n=1 Tax=Candidatus Paracaedibacter symbiosus TaxID=244582 RepID=UPI000509CA1D|nr:hypothetical protein [Candidatus Paracaedibacter symbiosus]